MDALWIIAYVTPVLERRRLRLERQARAHTSADAEALLGAAVLVVAAARGIRVSVRVQRAAARVRLVRLLGRVPDAPVVLRAPQVSATMNRMHAARAG